MTGPQKTIVEAVRELVLTSPEACRFIVRKSSRTSSVKDLLSHMYWMTQALRHAKVSIRDLAGQRWRRGFVTASDQEARLCVEAAS